MTKPASAKAWTEGLVSQSWLEALSGALDPGVLLVSDENELVFASAKALELLEASTTAELAAEWPALSRGIEGFRAFLERQDSRTRLEVDGPAAASGRRLRWELFRAQDTEPCVVFVRDAEAARAADARSFLATRFLCYSRLHRAAAHELRDPLNTIALNLEILRLECSKPSAADEGLAALERTFQGFCTAFQTFLRSSQPAQDNSGRFDFGDLMTDLCALLAPLARQQGLTLRLHKPQDPVRFTGRRERLREALILAVVRVLDAVPPGGELELSLESTGKLVRIGISGEIDSLLSGSGAEPGAERGGDAENAALELRLARAALEEHAGSMRFEPRTPRGATLTIELRSEPSAARTP